MLSVSRLQVGYATCSWYDSRTEQLQKILFRAWASCVCDLVYFKHTYDKGEKPRVGQFKKNWSFSKIQEFILNQVLNQANLRNVIILIVWSCYQAPPPTDSSRLGAGAAAVANAAGHELADFSHRELLFGLTTTGNIIVLLSYIFKKYFRLFLWYT